MTDRVEDVHPGPGRLPPDIIVAPVQDARPLPRWRQRSTAGTAVLVLAVAVALVVPSLVFFHGWSEAQMIRGIGAGRGVVTVAACGDRKVSVSTDSDGNRTTTVTYTCTGTFHSRSVSLADVAVKSDFDYRAGVSTAAYVTGATHVRLADNRSAAVSMSLWFTLACFLAAVEAAFIRLLRRRIRGRRRIGRANEFGDTAVLAVTGSLMAAPMLVLFWLVSFLALLGIYAL
jgi:hypothetical protein